jgi:predicted nucleic acid-binding protein
VEGYLLDTCAVSALLDGQHKNHVNMRSALDAIEEGAPRYVSAIAVAEVMFGALADEASGHLSPRLTAFLKEVQNYPIREITKHTRSEYAELRKNLAVTYLPTLLKSDRPRWVDNWVDRVTGEKLQIDENDLWICAQAREWNLTLVTTDEKMVIRMSKADSSLKFLFVRSR